MLGPFHIRPQSRAHSMKKLFSLVFSFALFAASLARAQTAGSQAKFFPDADLMRIGVYYYPEAWPQDQWPRDIPNIKKMNLEFVHMGEFAWAYMEPYEGRFDFDWLEKAVDLCAAQGL